MVDTLAAAYAKSGDFDSAANWLERAIALLDVDISDQERDNYSSRLADYKAKKAPRKVAVALEDNHLPWTIKFYEFADANNDAVPDNWDTVIEQPPLVEKQVERIDFAWGDKEPAIGVPRDHFGAVAAGNFKLDPGKYRLETISDDGVRVWIDNKLVIDNWHAHAATTDSAEVSLEGTSDHAVRIDYFDANFDATLKFSITQLNKGPAADKVHSDKQ